MDLLTWAIIALAVAVVAGLFGFAEFSEATGIAASVPQVLFLLLLTLAGLLFLVRGLLLP